MKDYYKEDYIDKSLHKIDSLVERFMDLMDEELQDISIKTWKENDNSIHLEGSFTYIENHPVEFNIAFHPWEHSFVR
ncbi:MAG: hypothetical protein IJ252_03985 [Solobacterium sp.]|nr:hypothetical protein [Solobacterium sp.]